MVAVKVGFGLALTITLYAVPFSGAQARAQQAGIPAGAVTQEQNSDLPQPEGSPLRIDFSGDPVLALAGAVAEPEVFRQILISAIVTSPVDREAQALERAAAARLDQADARALPTLDLGVSAFKTLDRNFSNDPENVLERSRPEERVDGTFQAAMPLFDFGANRANSRAAAARLRAAGFEREARIGEVAYDTVSAWTQVVGYQALEQLVLGYLRAQDDFDEAVATRITHGVSAESDTVRIAAIRASAQVQLAQIRRQLAGARARFEQLTGVPAPTGLLRPPLLDEQRITQDYAVYAAENSAGVQRAEALARASANDAQSARAQTLPSVTGRVDGGRYGLFERERNDFDIRATVNLNWRIFGGGLRENARAADADAVAAQAVADRIREEAIRDASIAWSEVQAIEEQVRALDQAYRAARQSRDVVAARFEALRGTLFDVGEAQDAHLQAASAYIQALTELDRARYILLLQTGRLTEIVNIDGEEGARK